MRIKTALLWLAPLGTGAQTFDPALASKPEAPACNTYRIEETPQLDLKQRLCLWTRRSIFSGEGISGAMVAAGAAQFRDDAADLRKGAAGYAIRFSTRYGQSVAKGMGETIGAYLNHEGARRELGPWKPRPNQPFGRRLAGALAAPFWNYDDDDPRNPHRRKRFAVSRIAAAFAGGFAGMAWTPDRLNTPGNALKRSGRAYGAYFSSSLWQEFRPDLAKLIRWF